MKNLLNFRRLAPRIAVVAFAAILAVGAVTAKLVHAQVVASGTLVNQSELAITPDILPDGTVGIPYSQTLMASTSYPGPFAWSIVGGSLPTGLYLTSSTPTPTSATNTTTSNVNAVISGTPTMAGQQFTFTLSATNYSSATQQTYVMNIDANTNLATTTATTAVVTTTPASSAVSATVSTTASTPAQIEAELESLTAELQQLLAQVGISASTTTTSVSTTISGTCVSATFCRTLMPGDTGSDVMALQTFLDDNGYPVATVGPGSAGDETDYFGSLTQLALSEWQAAHGITTTPAGIFDVTTMTAVQNEMSANPSSSASAPMIPYVPSTTIIVSTSTY